MRKSLGLKPGMRVNITVEGKSALITPMQNSPRATLAEIHALLNYRGPTIPINDMRAPDFSK